MGRSLDMQSLDTTSLLIAWQSLSTSQISFREHEKSPSLANNILQKRGGGVFTWFSLSCIYHYQLTPPDCHNRNCSSHFMYQLMWQAQGDEGRKEQKFALLVAASCYFGAAAHGLQLAMLNINRANTVMEASEALLDKLCITENSTNVALLT